LSYIFIKFVTKIVQNMSLNIENQILNKIKKAKRGSLFFTENFIKIGSSDAIRKALERLVKNQELERVTAGMYVRPEIDRYIGKVPPNIEAIAEAIAKRDGARIVPTGVYALNRLGLSTQVPMNIIYLTDGSARKVNIDNRNIVFKRVSPKNVATVGEISGLVIQALRTIGKENVKEDEIIKIQELLKKEKPTRLAHDIRLAPSWIRAIMQSVLNQPINEQRTTIVGNTTRE
jgi:RNase H-fold protein (predicted Holliday junction resolvase)